MKRIIRNRRLNLYDLRSQVLHGRRLSASREARRIVRRIAAGVVRAICVWKALWEKELDESPTWENLISELGPDSGQDRKVIDKVQNLSELLPMLFKKYCGGRRVWDGPSRSVASRAPRT